MPTWPVRYEADTTPLMKAPSWGAAAFAAESTNGQGQLCGATIPDDRVLPVVADVGDPVGPAHHLALGRGRRRARPAVVGDPIQGLGTQIEGSERHLRPPRRRGRTPRSHRGRRVLAGMPAWPVPAVVPEGNGFGECHIQAASPCDGRGDLRHLERMGEPRALVILGKDEDLGLAGQPAERFGVQNAVAISSKQVRQAIRLFVSARSPAPEERVAPGASSESSSLLAFRDRPSACSVGHGAGGSDPGAGPMRACESPVGEAHGPRSRHGRCPTGTALRWFPDVGGPSMFQQSAPSPSIVEVGRGTVRRVVRGGDQVDVRIGITHSPKEIEVEMPDVLTVTRWSPTSRSCSRRATGSSG